MMATMQCWAALVVSVSVLGLGCSSDGQFRMKGTVPGSGSAGSGPEAPSAGTADGNRGDAGAAGAGESAQAGSAAIGDSGEAGAPADDVRPDCVEQPSDGCAFKDTSPWVTYQADDEAPGVAEVF